MQARTSTIMVLFLLILGCGPSQDYLIKEKYFDRIEGQTLMIKVSPNEFHEGWDRVRWWLNRYGDMPIQSISHDTMVTFRPPLNDPILVGYTIHLKPNPRGEYAFEIHGFGSIEAFPYVVWGCRSLSNYVETGVEPPDDLLREK